MTSKLNITAADLQQMKQRGEKISVLTAYDASFANIMDACGVDVVLVGDSLGMVMQGHDSTLPVSVDDMVYHTSMVCRGVQHALVVSDLPYHSYESIDDALRNGQRLLDAGAHMVKLEGGEKILPMVDALIKNNVPVCGHLGLLPQSVEELGGYKVQGRDAHSAEQILKDAKALQAAGVSMVVLECIPSALAKKISLSIDIPTIGIGAGVDCDGQVLVVYDMLGITRGKRPRFVRNFLTEVDSDNDDKIAVAIESYVRAVKQGSFPTDAHSYN